MNTILPSGPTFDNCTGIYTYYLDLAIHSPYYSVLMKNDCTVQLFADGTWHDAASVVLLDPETRGWRARTMTGYATEWALNHAGAIDACALCSQLPVSLELQNLAHWPVILIDMLPQGYGRAELLRQLQLPETAEEAADWRLLLAGTGNPIGHLRIKEAARWLEDYSRPHQGFTDEEVAQRSSDFMQFLSMHGLFVAGSSGVQGEWPKVLLTRGHDGLLYLDHTLPDSEAIEHFIVKFGRGPNERLAMILRHEAAYMAIAGHLGLRVRKPLVLRQQALFVPRFDRLVTAGGVTRLAQESIATLTGRAGFGVVPTHNEVCRKLAEVCSDPLSEIIEYLRRDIANIALGNKDNHARNTALQRDFSGHIALTPLFDFAPMYLHPEGIARRIRWEQGDADIAGWPARLDAVSSDCGLPRQALAEALAAMAPKLKDVAHEGRAFGLEAELDNFLSRGIAAQAAALEHLS
jgi:serine/threonine-protein kinase HipA